MRNLKIFMHSLISHSKTLVDLQISASIWYICQKHGFVYIDAMLLCNHLFTFGFSSYYRLWSKLYSKCKQRKYRKLLLISSKEKFALRNICMRYNCTHMHLFRVTNILNSPHAHTLSDHKVFRSRATSLIRWKVLFIAFRVLNFFNWILTKGIILWN